MSVAEDLLRNPWAKEDQEAHHPLKDECCSICKGELYHPFLYWHGWEGERECKDVVFICRVCCINLLKPGVIADLVQVEAIEKLRKLGMHQMTLVREVKHSRERVKQIRKLEKKAAMKLLHE